jgi:hypothetical protein
MCWPASPETFELLPLLRPLGDIETCRFADWRNGAVKLSEPRCASAIYSRTGEAYLLLANLDRAPREVTCVLHSDKLPHPLARPTTAAIVASSAAAEGRPVRPVESALNAGRLTGEGIKVTIPGDGAVVIRVR